MATKRKKALKDSRLMLISELMKNSRRSDRELSRVLSISQPTVGRIIRKMKKQGIIKEYTMIPDFLKLGYKIMALTFCSFKELNPDEHEKTATAKPDLSDELSQRIIMLERGLGLENAGAIVSLHTSYSSYVETLHKLKEHPFLDMSKSQSFLIDLSDRVRYRPLTLSALTALKLNNDLFA